MSRRALAHLALAAGLGAALGRCDKDTARSVVESFKSGPPQPDTLPQMLNAELPFTYPPDLYTKRAQGNVTLHLFVDSTGLVRPESTAVAETSGYRELDSAAIAGSRLLRFRPAKRRAQAVPVAILFPVFFRHPQGRPLPSDTILKKPGGG